MAEYSKIARGSFAQTATYQVIYLPFVPDYVKVWNIIGANVPTAPTGTVCQIEWDNSMAIGDGLIYQKLGAISGTPTGYYYPEGAVGISGAGTGITPFYAGLSFSFGAPVQIASITKSTSPTTINTSGNHGYNIGDIVFLEGITNMDQMAGIPFQILPTGLTNTAFEIAWNTSGSNYTNISGSPAGAYVRKIYNPFLYAPGVSNISSIALGSTTTVVTTAPNNFVVGQEVAFRIPPQWGTTQLNSLPNNFIPGSPMYGYVVSTTPSTNTFVVNINSSSFTPFNSNPVYIPGLTQPQVLAIGDVNSGGVQISSGSQLYPSPVINGMSTTNGPAIQGAFVNNTRQGFVVGSAALQAQGISTPFYWAWYAEACDYKAYNVVGLSVA